MANYIHLEQIRLVPVIEFELNIHPRHRLAELEVKGQIQADYITKGQIQRT